MIRLITITIVTCLTLTAFGQSSFYKSLTGLSEISYVLVASNDCAYTIQDGLGCNIQPIDNWYNQRLRNREVTVDTIDYRRIKGIESFAIRGTKEIEPKTYGRAEVMKWTFSTIVDAKNTEKIISKGELSEGDRLHKAPWTWWRDGEHIYFILTGGTYVKPDLRKIESKLKEKIG